MANVDEDPAKWQAAREYWGYELVRDARPTEKLDRLLRGIATCISNEIEPYGGTDLTPSQMAAFYELVGGDYDALFLDAAPANVAFIYKSLGCLHSLQPNIAERKYIYCSPSIPALKPEGFIRWQTIQLMLLPEAHVPFLQAALREFDVIDPADGKPFLKLLPADAFPDRPNDDVVKWHDGISNRLQREAYEAKMVQERWQRDMQSHAQSQLQAHAHAHRDARTPPFRPPPHHRDHSPDRRSYEEQRTEAAHYFSNPVYRNREGRPTIVRRFSKATPRFVKEKGRVVASTVRQIASPHLWTNSANANNNKHRRSSERDRSGTYTPDRDSPSRELVRYDDRQSQWQTGRQPSGSGQNSGSERPTPTSPYSTQQSRPSHRRHPSSGSGTNSTRHTLRHYRSHSPNTNSRPSSQYQFGGPSPQPSSGRGEGLRPEWTTPSPYDAAYNSDRADYHRSGARSRHSSADSGRPQSRNPSYSQGYDADSTTRPGSTHASTGAPERGHAREPQPRSRDRSRERDADWDWRRQTEREMDRARGKDSEDTARYGPSDSPMFAQQMAQAQQAAQAPPNQSRPYPYRHRSHTSWTSPRSPLSEESDISPGTESAGRTPPIPSGTTNAGMSQHHTPSAFKKPSKRDIRASARDTDATAAGAPVNTSTLSQNQPNPAHGAWPGWDEDRPAEAYYRRGSAPSAPSSRRTSQVELRRGSNGTKGDEGATSGGEAGKSVDGVSGRRYQDTSPWR